MSVETGSGSAQCGTRFRGRGYRRERSSSRTLAFGFEYRIKSQLGSASDWVGGGVSLETVRAVARRFRPMLQGLTFSAGILIIRWLGCQPKSSGVSVLEAALATESPLTVESREELVYLLGEACELEHGLMCEYMYAQFSLKHSVAEGLTQAQLARVQVWESSLIAIIKQEMLHLALATNILTAVGAAPHFERPNFPIWSRWYPSKVRIALLPFGEQALRHFMYLERPEGMDLVDAEAFVPAPEAEAPKCRCGALARGSRTMADGWPPLPWYRCWTVSPIRALRRRRRLHRPTDRAGDHRDLRVGGADRRYRPRLSSPSD